MTWSSPLPLQRNGADMVALVYRAPRTVQELMQITGLHERTVRAWMRALIDEGLVCTEDAKSTQKNRPVKLYRWAPVWEVSTTRSSAPAADQGAETVPPPSAGRRSP